MKKLILLLVLISFNSTSLHSQLETNHWYFGPGLDFSTNPPSPDYSGRKVAGEGTSSISDENGQLLFYMTQNYGLDTIYNRLHQPMANGDGINGNSSSTQGALIVKKPGAIGIYYLFTECGLFGAGASAGGIRYSEININLASGNGSVTAKNIPLYLNATWGQSEKVSAVRHCNGIDVWLMTYDIAQGNHFRCFLVSAAGVNTTAVISLIGASQMNIIGQAKFSPNGRKIGFGDPGELFDFDAATGQVSNSLLLNDNGYGCEFSPDGTKFYMATVAAGSSVIYQWDLCAGSNAAILASKTTVGTGPAQSMNFGSMQNALDGKIYVATLPTNSISVINNPNASGMACNFQLQAQLVGTTVCQWSLPNFVTSNFKQLPNPYTYTLSTCTTATFTAPPIPTLAPVCGAASFQYSSFVWDFGDPASGASNTSSLTNVSHQFTSSGNFTVKLILKGNCTNDTLRQRITIPNPLQISNASTVCAGANVILQASGASNFSWNTGSPNSSISVQPATTTTYVVTGTVSPACVMTKSVLVTVSKCSSINEWTTKDKKLVYPNPFTDELTIEIQQASELVVMDALGRIVLRNAISTGIQVVNTEELPAGIYFIKLQNPNGQEIFRRVKVD